MESRSALLSALLACAASAADYRITLLCKRLATAGDPRLRVQAALGLGGGNDRAAIGCLCSALDDPSPGVRASGGKALAQLADPAALGCLKRHLDDPSAEARGQIKRAYDLVEGQHLKSGLAAVYVVLAPPDNKLDPPDPTLAKLADQALRAALAAKGVTVAAATQRRAEALAWVQSQGLKGFDLRPGLRSAPQRGLLLTLFAFSLRDGQLLGEVGATARGPALPELVRALAPNVVSQAADEWSWGR